MATLVTGHAGFIGFHCAKALLARGDAVVGVDVVNDYYDPALKRARLKQLDLAAAKSSGRYTSLEGDLAEAGLVAECFASAPIERVIHLAAQAGVRYSLENPLAYVQSNVVAFTHLLEACRHHGVAHLTYASTSSVYGINRKLPFHEDDGADHPLQFYAATKRSNELMAHAYSHLFGLPTTGLRFFTVYGPWGRPDMAPFKFTKCVIEGKPIPLFNHGRHSRDFTYVDDIVEGVIRASDRAARPDPDFDPKSPRPSTSAAPFAVFNIGNSQPVDLIDFVRAIEKAVGRAAELEMLPMQPGDVSDTLADTTRIESELGYKPATDINDGVADFVAWYRQYYRC